MNCGLQQQLFPLSSEISLSISGTNSKGERRIPGWISSGISGRDMVAESVTVNQSNSLGKNTQKVRSPVDLHRFDGCVEQSSAAAAGGAEVAAGRGRRVHGAATTRCNNADATTNRCCCDDCCQQRPATATAAVVFGRRETRDQERCVVSRDVIREWREIQQQAEVSRCDPCCVAS